MTGLRTSAVAFDRTTEARMVMPRVTSVMSASDSSEGRLTSFTVMRGSDPFFAVPVGGRVRRRAGADRMWQASMQRGLRRLVTVAPAGLGEGVRRRTAHN